MIAARRRSFWYCSIIIEITTDTRVSSVDANASRANGIWHSESTAGREMALLKRVARVGSGIMYEGKGGPGDV